MCDTVHIVIPCFNEEEILRATAKQIETKVKSIVDSGLINKNSKVLFVNDGSKDRTWDIIKGLHGENDLFSGINLAHNRGEQNAYLSGMMTAKDKADFVITMDADLQDDIHAIDEMIAKYYEGNDIVYGVRASRENEPVFIRASTRAFYKLMRVLGTELIPDHSQYRLMSRRALDALSLFEERNLFLPALIPLIGFKSAIVYHGRKKREVGKSKYSVKSLFRLACEAITSFSLKPLRLVHACGIVSWLIAAGIGIYTAIGAAGGNFDGWLLVLASVWAVAGVVFFSVGIVGEYIGRMYMESKRRPRWFIDETLLEDDDG